MRLSVGSALILAVLLTATLGFSTGALAADSPVGHRLTVINDGPAAVSSLAYAPTGTDRWFSVAGGPIAPGAAGQAVLTLPGSACAFDFRVRQAGQPAVRVKAWNACRNPVLHVGGRNPK